MRESLCIFFNYFFFSKHSVTLAEEETDIMEDWWLLATPVSTRPLGDASSPRNCFLLFPLLVPTRQVTQA